MIYLCIPQSNQDKTQEIEPQIKSRHKSLILISVFIVRDDERPHIALQCVMWDPIAYDGLVYLCIPQSNQDTIQEIDPRIKLRHKNLILISVFKMEDDERPHTALQCVMSKSIA